MKTLLLILILAVFSQEAFALEGVTTEEYAVYSDLLGQMEYSKTPITFVINNETSDREKLDENSVKYYEDNSMFTASGAFNLKLDEGLVKDYNRKNSEPHKLEKKFSVPQIVFLVSSEELDEIFWGGGGGWDEFYAIYPTSTGTISLSRVGFNKEKNQAFVYFANQSHYKAGAGYYIMLSKEGDNWKIIDRVMIWIS